MKELPRLQFISQGADKAMQLRYIQQVLDRGCQWIQVRFKNAARHELLVLAEDTKKLCVQYEALCLINDDVEVAKAVDADGVHLGLTDTAIAEARSVLGEGKIIGGTANTLTDVLRRVEEGCHYIGLGPFRFTTTKDELSPILGLEGYRDIISAMRLENMATPIYAIGGVQKEDIAALYETGVYGIAASTMLLK